MCRVYRFTCIILCIAMLATFLSGCQGQGGIPQSDGIPAQGEDVIDQNNDNMSEPVQEEQDLDLGTPEDGQRKSEEESETPEESIFYPSGKEFVKSIVDLRGNIDITDEMRNSFNIFARDYRWCYLPDADGYESFFEDDDFYNVKRFARAVFYELSYMGYPEKVSAKDMEKYIQSMFVSKSGIYEDMPHMEYGRFANFEDGSYSPRPEGGPDHDRMFYLLTDTEIEQRENNDIYITVRAKRYYFNDPAVYEMGEDEKWLDEKAKELDLTDEEAAARLISDGKMAELPAKDDIEAVIYIEDNGKGLYKLNPRIVFSYTK